MSSIVHLLSETEETVPDRRGVGLATGVQNWGSLYDKNDFSVKENRTRTGYDEDRAIKEDLNRSSKENEGD